MLIPHLGSASENCSQITKTYRPFPECSKVCTRNCEYKIYGYSVNNAPINEANKTTVILLADPFVYPFYEEYLLIEARQFLGTLGGNLSFWFGASFLVLLHVLVFLIRIPIELVKNRPHKSTVISTGNLTTPNQVNKENVELKQTKTEPPINSEKSSIQLIGSGNK